MKAQEIEKQSDNPEGISRRNFITLSGAAFTLGMYLPSADLVAKERSDVFEPNAFIKIHPDNQITLLIKHLDMGQGAFTGLSTLLAEELDADWELLTAEHAPADVSKYAHTEWGPNQGTGGSSGLRNSFMQMRQAGATAKAMLVAAAAQLWKTDISKLKTENSFVIDSAAGKKISYGELAELASTQAIPDTNKLVLKNPNEFKYIGKPVKRLDQGKEDGTAIYTQDIQLPNMLTAVVAHPPKFGAVLKSFDAKQTKSMDGIVDVVSMDHCVAVVGDNFWLAKKGRDALSIEWDESNAEVGSSDTMTQKYRQLAETKGNVASESGDVSAQLQASDHNLELDFEFPYLAHATMEPMNCVAKVTDEGCEIWSGIQSQTNTQRGVASALGINVEQVKINTLFAGGSFGRRGVMNSDYSREAALIAKQFKGRPVKLVWTRENDMKTGWFRPMYVHKVKAGMNKKGDILAWHHNIVGQSILQGTALASWGIKNGVDRTTVDGLTEIPYRMASHKVETVTTNSFVKVPTLWWRAVGNTHTAFAKEVMIDKMAKTVKKDPLDFRLAHLDDQPRHAGVLKQAAKTADWKKTLPKGWGRGIAVHKSFGTYVALVAEVSTNQSGEFKVERVVCAVDCGVPVNPSIIEAQMQGGIGYGLAAVHNSEITLKDGVVQEDNFHTYEVLRMPQMPKVDVVILPSAEPPTGVGEPSTGVIAPAVVNALADATGKYFTKLPIKKIS